MDFPLRLPAHAPSGVALGYLSTESHLRTGPPPTHASCLHPCVVVFSHPASFLKSSISGCLLQTILGGWDRANPVGRNLTSKLAQEVADKELCHSYMTFNTCYKVALNQGAGT